MLVFIQLVLHNVFQRFTFLEATVEPLYFSPVQSMLPEWLTRHIPTADGRLFVIMLQPPLARLYPDNLQLGLLKTRIEISIFCINEAKKVRTSASQLKNPIFV